MRIAINAWFLNQTGTGSGQYLEGLLRAVPGLENDHEFLLVTPPGDFEFEVPGLQVEFWPLQSSRWQSNRAGRVGKVLFEQVAFPRICRHWGADVAHVPYWGSSLWPSVPTVVTIHDIIPLLLPAYRGGPMFYADLIGLDKILDTVKRYAKSLGESWKPAKLLEKLVNEGKGFKDLT